MLIIFSGYNQRAVITFLRTLSQNSVQEYAIIAASEEDTILQTDYAKKVYYIRKNKALDFDEIYTVVKQISIMQKEQKCLIVPSTEALNRFLLDNRIRFEEAGCVIPLADRELYEKISDKESFWELCHKSGLPVPNRKSVNEVYNIPFVAKPKKYFSINGNVYYPVIVKSQEDFQKFKQKYTVSEQEAFDYQEYVEGRSFYLLFYFTRNGQVYSFSQENYMQQPGGKSILAAVPSKIHMEGDIADAYKNLFLRLRYHGFVMVELRKRGDEYIMIEANPRLWGPSQLFFNAGYNLFEFFLAEYGIIDNICEKTINWDAKYFWSGGMNGSIYENNNYMWFGEGIAVVRENLNDFHKYDIYNNEDTIKIFDMKK